MIECAHVYSAYSCLPTAIYRTSQTGVLPLGSDFPVEGINPLLGFYAAVTHLSVSGQSPHGSQGWYDI